MGDPPVIVKLSVISDKAVLKLTPRLPATKTPVATFQDKKLANALVNHDKNMAAVRETRRAINDAPENARSMVDAIISGNAYSLQSLAKIVCDLRMGHLITDEST